jgi:adhesin transport system outer membrane protein
VQNAANYRYADAKASIEESTRNAWEQLKTAKLNAVMLKNQANIASEFLVFARKERTLGRRSLLDVLGGETALINSSSDAASASIDIAIAGMTLLDAMGELSEGALSR